MAPLLPSASHVSTSSSLPFGICSQRRFGARGISGAATRFGEAYWSVVGGH
jgi:hypothetical protein